MPGDLRTFGYRRPSHKGTSGCEARRRAGVGGGGMIRAFVFDLDGTLVETEKLKALSYARAAAELRPDLNEGEVIEA